jgi:hypothetical protein
MEYVMLCQVTNGSTAGNGVFHATHADSNTQQ